MKLYDIIISIIGGVIIKTLTVGQAVQIHSYKHDGIMHRIWRNAIVIKQTDEYLILGNYKTRVIEADGRNWMTKEPAICYFFKDLWFNVIGMLKKDGIYYYCNLSSPYVYDGEAVKYIDYDLDVRISADGKYKILDQEEYLRHQIKYNYPEAVKKIVEAELNVLLKMYKNKAEPFTHDFIRHYYEEFKKLS